MATNDYVLNLQEFSRAMRTRIRQNMKKKGLSWRDANREYLVTLIKKYRARKDWVSVGNIAFMLWENEQHKIIIAEKRRRE